MSENREALMRRICAAETRARKAIPEAEWFRLEDLAHISNMDKSAAALVVAASPAFVLELCEWARRGLAAQQDLLALQGEVAELSGEEALAGVAFDDGREAYRQGREDALAAAVAVMGRAILRSGAHVPADPGDRHAD